MAAGWLPTIWHQAARSGQPCIDNHRRVRGSHSGSRPLPRTTAMALIFPNRSRSFDEARKGVRFTGYDGMFEVRFLIEEAALGSAITQNSSEAAYLNAFDAARSSIQEAASRVYQHRRGNNFTLTAADFR
ncbi:hypothetical protein ACVMH6_004544 [Rhizobium leguminosarum]